MGLQAHLPAYALRHRRRRTVYVAYDVLTTTPGGPRRLRLAGQACESFGRRVQWSVFVCHLTPVELRRLRSTMLRILDIQTDRLLIVPIRAGDDVDAEELGLPIARPVPEVLQV